MKTWQKTELPLFDAVAANQAKERGISLAVENRKELVAAVRAIAVELLKKRTEISMDDVVEAMPEHGLNPDDLGNASGGVLRCKTFECTERQILSRRVRSHSNRIFTYRMRAN
jgi:hypothetical protein